MPIAVLLILAVFHFVMFYYRAIFWGPVAALLPPSFILLILLLVAIIRWQRKGEYNTFAYRLFIVQSLHDLLLLLQYLAGSMLIEDRLIVSREVILSTNGGILPNYYYHGTIYYFFHVLMWGGIEQFFLRFLRHFAPRVLVSERIQKAGYLPIMLINILVPAALSARGFFQETIGFSMSEDGNAVLTTSPQVVESNDIQSALVAATAAIVCALFYIPVVGKLVRRKKPLSESEASKSSYRYESKLNVVGLLILLAQCSVAAHYAIVAHIVPVDPEIVEISRNAYIVPVLILVFVHPWTLFFQSKNHRRQMICR